MKPVAKTPIVPDRRARLEHRIAAMLRRLGLYTLVHALYGRFFKKSREARLPVPGAVFRPTQLAQLTPQARKIYADLKDAIKHHRQGGA